MTVFISRFFFYDLTNWIKITIYFSRCLWINEVIKVVYWKWQWILDIFDSLFYLRDTQSIYLYCIISQIDVCLKLDAWTYLSEITDLNCDSIRVWSTIYYDDYVISQNLHLWLYAHYMTTAVIYCWNRRKKNDLLNMYNIVHLGSCKCVVGIYFIASMTRTVGHSR